MKQISIRALQTGASFRGAFPSVGDFSDMAGRLYVLNSDPGRFDEIYALRASRLATSEDRSHKACRRRRPNGAGVDELIG
jgi:hypothetical protein